MKKIIILLTIFLWFGFSSVFAQDFKYTGFLETISNTYKFAVINKMIYETGDIIKNSSYMVVKIEYNSITLKNIIDGKTIKVVLENNKLKN